MLSWRAVRAPLRVLLVEDDAEFVEALELVLGSELELHAAGCIADVPQQLDFDVACVDLGLPDGDGTEVVARLTAQAPELPVIVITVQRSDRRILAAVRAGARGYLLKEHIGSRIRSAIDEVLEGGAPMSPSIARRLLSLVASLPAVEVAARAAPNLTERELSVVRKFSEGLSYEQAAAALGISINTLRTHVRNVYDKLAVGTRTEAVLSALELGLLTRR